MESLENPKFFYVKITFPITSEIKTFKGINPNIYIGSDKQSDIILVLPSISPVHLIVNFNEKKLKAIGSDVHCDGLSLAIDATTSFNNRSLVSIHNIFMAFIQEDEFNDISLALTEAEDRIIKAASKYTHFSPYLKIAHCIDNKEFALVEVTRAEELQKKEKIAIEFNKNQKEIEELYKKELGEFSEMPILTHQMNSEEQSDVPQEFPNLTEKMPILTHQMNSEEQSDVPQEFPNLTEKKVLCTQLATEIDSSIRKVEDSVHLALDGVNDIGIIRTPIPDLGETAIRSELLQNAKHEIDEMISLEESKIDLERDIVGLEKDKLDLEKEILKLEENKLCSTDELRERVMEAEIRSIDELKTSITDSMKEEFRNTISNLVQEEAKDQVEKEVEKCIQNTKFTQVLVDAVSEQSKDTIDSMKNQIKELQDNKSQSGDENKDDTLMYEPKKRMAETVEEEVSKKVKMSNGDKKPEKRGRKIKEKEKELTEAEEEHSEVKTERTEQEVPQKENETDKESEDELSKIEETDTVKESQKTAKPKAATKKEASKKTARKSAKQAESEGSAEVLEAPKKTVKKNDDQSDGSADVLETPKKNAKKQKQKENDESDESADVSEAPKKTSRKSAKQVKSEESAEKQETPKKTAKKLTKKVESDENSEEQEKKSAKKSNKKIEEKEPSKKASKKSAEESSEVKEKKVAPKKAATKKKPVKRKATTKK